MLIDLILMPGPFTEPGTGVPDFTGDSSSDSGAKFSSGRVVVYL